jgi:hypothetical protein
MELKHEAFQRGLMPLMICKNDVEKWSFAARQITLREPASSQLQFKLRKKCTYQVETLGG